MWGHGNNEQFYLATDSLSIKEERKAHIKKTWERPPIQTFPVKIESPRPGAIYDTNKLNSFQHPKKV
jgi:hypothetical protein